MNEEERRKKLRARLRSKINEKKLIRSDKKTKKDAFETTLEENGLSVEKFNESIKILSKYGNDKKFTTEVDEAIKNEKNIDKNKVKNFLELMKSKDI